MNHTGKVRITGSGRDMLIEIDGQKVERCIAFTIYADGPDSQTKLILELLPSELDITGDFGIETLSRGKPKVETL